MHRRDSGSPGVIIVDMRRNGSLVSLKEEVTESLRKKHRKLRVLAHKSP